MTNNIASILNKKYIAVSAITMMMVGITTLPAFAQEANTSIMEPVSMHISASTSDCTNNPGPYITLSGTMVLGQVGAQFTFQNNADGTHTYTTSTTSTAVIPQGDTIKIPKQPALGGVGGNPYIYLQYVDNNGNPLTAPIFLGRCVQGLSDANADFAIASTLMADVSALDCSNKASTISLSGSLALSGINTKLIFSNSPDGPHVYDASMTTSLIPSGMSIVFPKQPSLGGVGGNPWIYLQFQDANSAAIGDTISLGRCVQNF